MPEPTVEWAISRVFPGMRELLLFAHTLIDKGRIALLSGGINHKDGLPAEVERTATGEQWMRTCDVACRELFAVDIHWFRSSGEGYKLCSKLLSNTGARNAIRGYFWSLMFDDMEGEDVALDPTGNRGVRLADLQRQKPRKRQRAASAPPTRRVLTRLLLPGAWQGER